MKITIATLFLLFAFGKITWSQTGVTRGSAIGISYIRNDFTSAQRIRSTSLSSAIRDKQFLRFGNATGGFALTYFKGMSPHIDLAATVSGSSTKMALPNQTFDESKFFLEGDASANFKMFPDNYRFSPYLIAGVGASRYRAYYAAFMPVGGGLKYNFRNGGGFFSTFQYRIPVTEETSDYHFHMSAGLSIAFKKKLAPALAAITDSDGDSLADNVDSCPSIYGLRKYHGCPVPDTDKDGINDEQDKCPTVPGVAKYQGCPVPDTDKDGINDDNDKCPLVAGVARYDGCPVPDSDGDGVNDDDDKCPQVAGTKANKGCPEVNQEIIKRIEYAAKRIFFITGSAKLSPKSNGALKEVVKLLAEQPTAKLSIEGHTDNIGKPATNKSLSEKRANSVRFYLIKSGVSGARINAQGFGSEVPVADNKTAKGRAKNRRVELKLAY